LDLPLPSSKDCGKLQTFEATEDVGRAKGKMGKEKVSRLSASRDEWSFIM
jgi:hypothetical protein